MSFKKARLSLRKFLSENKGVAAIEFALIAPVMIAFYFGLAETTLAISKDRNVAHTASVVGDLATQVSELDGDGIEDIMTAGLAVLNIGSDEISDVSIEIYSFIMKTDGSSGIERIGYARLGSGVGPSKDFQAHGLSKNMLNETSGAVVARVYFRYKPKTLMFVNNMVLSETFVLKPRKSLAVPIQEGTNDRLVCSATASMEVSCRAA